MSCDVVCVFLGRRLCVLVGSFFLLKSPGMTVCSLCISFVGFEQLAPSLSRRYIAVVVGPPFHTLRIFPSSPFSCDCVKVEV